MSYRIYKPKLTIYSLLFTPHFNMVGANFFFNFFFMEVVGASLHEQYFEYCSCIGAKPFVVSFKVTCFLENSDQRKG